MIRPPYDQRSDTWRTADEAHVAQVEDVMPSHYRKSNTTRAYFASVGEEAQPYPGTRWEPGRAFPASCRETDTAGLGQAGGSEAGREPPLRALWQKTQEMRRRGVGRFWCGRKKNNVPYLLSG